MFFNISIFFNFHKFDPPISIVNSVILDLEMVRMFGYIQNWISKNGNVGTLMHFDEHIVHNILLPIKIDSFEIFFDI